MSDKRSSGHPGGRLWLAPGLSASEAEAARAFVAAGPHLDMAELPGGRRPHDDRALAEPDVPGIGVCVLKAFGAGSSARPLRKLRKALQLRFAPPARRTLRTAAALRAAAVPSFDAIAAWTERRGPYRNFLLYRRLEGTPLGDRWMGAMPFRSSDPRPLSPDALRAYAAKAGALARDLAEVGFIHVDLHPGNLIVPSAMDGTGPVELLDLDAVRRAPGCLWGRRVRFTSFLKSLRHIAECFPDEADEAFGAFVRAYCRGDASAERAVCRALALWRARTGRSRLAGTVASFLSCPPPPRPDGAPHPWDAPPRAVPRYDLVFSLGYDCNCSLALRRAGLQFRSYPFDWLKKAPLAARADLLARRFAGWLAPDGLRDEGAASFDRFAKRHRVVTDVATGLEMRHDFPLERSVAEGLPEVARKYARRTARLLSEIEAAERVAVVFCVGFRFPHLPMADLVAARETLRAVFGEKIDVIGIADDAPGGPADRPPLIGRVAGGHVLRASIPCLVETPQGIEVNERRVAAFLRGLLVVADPRTAAEKRGHRALERRRLREKYAARTWIGLQWNRLLFRCYRSLAKKLQRKGILPPNEAAT